MFTNGRWILSLIVFSGIFLAWLSWYNKRTSKKYERKRKNKKLKYVVPGLLNVGNTCFMNVVLQSLASTSKLYIAFQKSPKSLKPVSAQDSLCEIIKVLNTGSDFNYYDPSNLLLVLKQLGWHISMDEHDAHEFFHVLLSTINEEMEVKKTECTIMNAVNGENISFNVKQRCIEDVKLLQNNSSSNVNLYGIFRGLLSIRLKCVSCGQKTPVKFDGFDSLSLPIPETSVWIGRTTISECLKQFFAAEVVKSVDCDNCTQLASAESTKKKIQRKQLGTDSLNMNKISEKLWRNYYSSDERKTSTVQTKIKSNFNREVMLAKLPQCLTFHLQRLVWKHGFPVKNHTHVQFEEFLNLSEFLFSTNLQRKNTSRAARKPNPLILKLLSNNNSRSNHFKTLNHCGLLGGFSDNVKHCKPQNAWYKLCAVVVHIGSWTESGHYVAYRRVPTETFNISKSKWVFTSDTVVRPASLSEVLSSTAYMLFYERVPFVG
ncbi:ubiquitin carboxyl-terminal hydrolase 30-like [Ciona intestinalis]